MGGGCSSSAAVGVIEPNKKQLKNHRPPTPMAGSKSIAFEVKLDGDNSDKLNVESFKSRLPKRLQRLKEEQSNTITTEEIAERQRLAEKRRKSAIEERVLKSKQFQAKLTTANNSLNNSLNSDSSRTSSATIKEKK